MKMKSRLTVLLLLCLSLAVSPAIAFKTADAARPTTTTPAADLRATMAKVYGEHSYMMVIAMQKQFNQSKDLPQAMAALNANTNSIASLLSSTYTDAAASQIKNQWKRHIQHFMDYVTATRNNNADARKAAQAGMTSSTTAMVNAMESQNPYINETKLLTNLRAHDTYLLQSFTSYAEGKYGTAYSAAHSAYARAALIGASMATATAERYPSKYKRTTTQTEAAYFRQQMGEALGEHTILSILMLQKGNDNAPDLPNVKAALDRNTQALTNTHQRLFGANAAATFNSLWNRHIRDYQAYMTATLNNDQAGRAAAKKDLGKFVADLTAFQTGRLPLNKTKTYQANAMHGAHVITAFDSYHSGGYAKSYEALRTGYNHMWMTGNTLSEAIVKKFPSKF
ncbi:hypothetical protein [Paenibacillus sp. Z6-24]